MKHTRPLPLIVLILAGCGTGDVADRWQGRVDTLANGAVRVTNPADGAWDEASAWHLVPQFALGRIEGEGAELFSAISGLEVDDHGRIYVLDRQANELRIFDADGTHVHSVGREGEGPGEYRNANGLSWLSSASPDSLVVIDQRGNRYSILTREGEYVRSVRRRLPFFGWAYSGNVHDGWIYENYSTGSGDDRQPVLLGTALRPASAGADLELTGTERQETTTAQDAVDTIMLPRPDGPLFQSFSVYSDRGGMVMSVPFAPGIVRHLDRHGELWFGHGGEFRVVHAALEGDTLTEILLDATPTPVSDEELEEWLAGSSVQRFRQMGGDLDLERIPESKPHFDGLYVDPEGYLWVSVPAEPMRVVFAVFDPDGRYLGRLEAEGMRRTPWVPPVVRGDRLHFVGSDELDVQRVFVYGIQR